MSVGRRAGFLGLTALAAVLLCAGQAGAAALPDFGSDAVEATPETSGSSSIADVRVGGNEGFDRFVVEFEGPFSTYFVSYVDQVVEDGSGDPVDVEGDAFIQVSLTGVPMEPTSPQDTIDAGLPGLVQVVGAGAGFEGVTNYGLGTTEAAGFRVFTLDDPPRLVVDIAHPDAEPTATNTDDPSSSSTATDPSATTSSAPVTPVDASDSNTSSNTVLLVVIIALAALALLAGIIGWRMRRST